MEKKYFTLFLTYLFVMVAQLLFGQDLSLNKKQMGVLGKKTVFIYEPGLLGQTRWLSGVREKAGGSYSDTRDLTISHHFSLERAIGYSRSVRLSYGTYGTTVGNAVLSGNFYGSAHPFDPTVSAASFNIREIAFAHRWYHQVSLVGSYFEMQVGIQSFTTPDSLRYLREYNNSTELVRSFNGNLPFFALSFGRRFLLGKNWVLGYQWQLHLSAIYFRTRKREDVIRSYDPGDFQSDFEYLMNNRVGGLQGFTAQVTLGYLF